MGATRRRFLTACAAAGIGLPGCTGPTARDRTPSPERGSTATAGRTATSTPQSEASDRPATATRVDPEAPVGVRGTIYLPARAFNVYQFWRDYDAAVVERDLGYAASVDLNAVRTWLSYERWKEADEATGEAVEHFLGAAADAGLAVLLGLFEGVGVGPTREHLRDRNPLTAVGTFEPSMDVVRAPERWVGPRRYVRWFMDRYRDDDRLLGIEVMNEPGWNIQRQFARGMFETLKDQRGTVPLTVGSTSLANNADYQAWGNEIIQFHYNFAHDLARYRDLLRQAVELRAATPLPVWLTEWQRVRTGQGFTSEVRGDEWQPNYASLAPIIAEHGIGNFFWTLMVQPAYTRFQREEGVITGLFHEDGAVWSLDDARAVKAMSGDGSFDAEERPAWPEWCIEVKRRYRG